jgi:CheY-like chemotaxis protein
MGARQFLHKPATTAQIFQAIAQVRTATQRSSAKVLIIDDDPEMLALLSSMLTPWGLETITLSDPQQFWKVLVTASPDLLLLDLEMPGVSGLELCQVVRQDAQRGDLPILVVTAHTDAQFLQQAFAAGADDFITKPVLGPELVTRVLSRLERIR